MDTIARSQIRELDVRLKKTENQIEMNLLIIKDLQGELSVANWLIRILCERHGMGGESLYDIKERLIGMITADSVEIILKEKSNIELEHVETCAICGTPMGDAKCPNCGWS